MSVSINIGNRLPAYAASTGRVLLAGEPDDVLERYLERVDLTQYTSRTITSKAKLRDVILEARRSGYSLVDEELEVGVRSLSVPIRDSRHRVIAALNACCPAIRFTVEDMEQQLVPELQKAADRINQGFSR